MTKKSETKAIPKDKPPKGSYTIIVDDKKCYLKKPSRQVYERVIGLITSFAGSEPQFLKAGGIIINSCWISGDEELKNDDNYHIPAAMYAIQLIEMKGAILKKN